MARRCRARRRTGRTIRASPRCTGGGYLRAGKVYAVYYDGSSTWSCGGGAWPPQLVGQVAAMYLRGTPPGAPPCSSNALAPDGQPGYFEFGVLHEIVHTLGYVAECAPHHTLRGHASDSPNDLRWAGDMRRGSFRPVSTSAATTTTATDARTARISPAASI